jgi:hypothetical protein
VLGFEGAGFAAAPEPAVPEPAEPAEQPQTLCGSQVNPSPQSLACSHGSRYRGMQVCSTVSVQTVGAGAGHFMPLAQGGVGATEHVPLLLS